MDRVKLSYKSFEELNELRLSIENDPKNRLPKGSFFTTTPQAGKKLDDIAWAITNKLKRAKVENGKGNHGTIQKA